MPSTEATFWNRVNPQDYTSLAVDDLARLLTYWEAYPLNRRVALGKSRLHASEVKALTARTFHVLKLACEDRGIDTGDIKVRADENGQHCREFARLRTKLQLESAQAPAADAKAAKEPKPTLTGEEKALAVLIAHSDWPDTRIAKEVGCHRSTLYGWPKFRAARQAMKGAKDSMPRGSKDGETGDVEAWE